MVLVDRDSLCFRVLAARNGLEGGHLCVGGRDGSAWWRNISALRSEGWFHSNVSRSLSDGTKALFWTDVWVGELSLRDRFSRLYELSLLKGETVAAMRALGWEEEGEAWRWRHRLFAWEEESVGELRLLLQNVSLHVHRKDNWKWKTDSSSFYIVRSAYNTLIAQVHIDNVVAAPSIWHKNVPLKVVLFVWRLLHDRLPTKDNLHRRHVIDSDTQICVSGCGLIETSTHLFLHCNLFGSVWNHIFQ